MEAKTFGEPVRIVLRWKRFFRRAYKQKYLYAMSVPFMLLVIVFSYVPIFGWTMAFQNFKLGKGFLDQTWVGLKWFNELWSDTRFWNSFRNTVAMSSMQIVAGFTIPIILALFLNEMRWIKYKRVIQTVSYLPHFVSWVVVSSMFIKLLSTDSGALNMLLIRLGVVDKPIFFMAKPTWFWGIITVVTAWKESGWSTIIYLSAIAGVDPGLYEAAMMDGCGRFRRMWYVTLPCISTTVIILLIMAIGHLTQIGFEKQMLMGNAIVIDYAEVIDWYALKYGIGTARYAFGTAIGVFNSVIAVILLISVNGISRKARNESVF